MRSKELMWRTLFDAAMSGRRRWASLDDLSFASGVPKTSAHRAVRKLLDIGAAEALIGGGLIVVSPDKVLTLMCAARDLNADSIVTTSVAQVDELLDTYRGPYALGGPDAAVTYLPSRLNTVAHITRRLLYLPEESASALMQDPEGTVTVLTMDRRAALEWTSGYSSLGQTFADLFAMPGWQASEFRLALRDAHITSRDWEEKAIDA